MVVAVFYLAGLAALYDARLGLVLLSLWLVALFLIRGDEMAKVMTKSAAAKKARSGADMGKKGKNFAKIAAKAGQEYGSAEAGKRVAGAIFQKQRKAGKL